MSNASAGGDRGGRIVELGYPQDERPYQNRRQLRLILFFASLFVLSVALEIYNRTLDAGELFAGLGQAFRALLDPNAPPPAFDPSGNALAIGALLRNMLPAAAMLWLVLWLGGRFMHALYGLSTWQEARSFLVNSLFGKFIGSGPTIVVSKGEVQGGGQQPSVRIGGPAALVMHSDSAALLEQAGRLTRVVGPGVHQLRRFEKIRAIVDLRPRWHSLTVEGMSREGIPVKCKVDVHYQIDHQGAGAYPATSERPHAYSEEAVFRAAITQVVPEFGATHQLDWSTLVPGGAGGTLRTIMARYPLDRLIQPLSEVPEPEDDADSAHPIPRQVMQAELEAKLRAGAPGKGAKILQVALRNIELSDTVTQQWVETWAAEWKKRQREELSVARAEWERQMARVRAEAEREMILAIIDGLQTLAEDRKPLSSDLVAMRFIETLQRVTVDSWNVPLLPFTSQVIDTLDKLRGMSGLAGTESGDKEAAPDRQVPRGPGLETETKA